MSISGRFAVALLCASWLGCSSSDDGTTPGPADSGPGGGMHACQVKAECFQTDGAAATVQALCNNFKGTVVAACSGTRVGCCHISENQCWYNSDGDALKAVCESQHGTWTPN